MDKKQIEDRFQKVSRKMLLSGVKNVVLALIYLSVNAVAGYAIWQQFGLTAAIAAIVCGVACEMLIVSQEYTAEFTRVFDEFVAVMREAIEYARQRDRKEAGYD